MKKKKKKKKTPFDLAMGEEGAGSKGAEEGETIEVPVIDTEANKAGSDTEDYIDRTEGNANTVSLNPICMHNTP